MIFGSDRSELRQMYADAWKKAQESLPMSPLETQIARVIAEHPEYHGVVEGDDLQLEFTPESGQSNPYLHMGLHLAIRDQVATDRPPGIRRLFAIVAAKVGDHHETEHKMLDCLAETMWQAQRDGKAPDEQEYLARVRRLA
jgi:hypothetical protein